MSIEAKNELLDNISARLSTEVTAAVMKTVMNIISDELRGFTIEAPVKLLQGEDDLLQLYLNALRVQQRSEKTIQRYNYIISNVLGYLGLPTSKVTVNHLRNFFSEEKQRGIAESTLEGTRQTLNAYFNWLQRETLIQHNPMANLGAFKVPEKIKEVYTDIDFEKLKMAAGTTRNKAILAFLMSTGCRISEMTQLNRDEVDLEHLECVVDGKGSKERTVYLSAVAGMLLREYLLSRKDNEEALFIGKAGERLQPNGVRLMLNNIAHRAGVPHVHPHKFRRTLATNLIKHGMPIQEVAAILGHDKLDTTMEYVVLDKSTIKNSYAKYA